MLLQISEFVAFTPPHGPAVNPHTLAPCVFISLCETGQPRWYGDNTYVHCLRQLIMMKILWKSQCLCFVYCVDEFEERKV